LNTKKGQGGYLKMGSGKNGNTQLTGETARWEIRFGMW
jgi:hypothetical protein